MGKRCFIELYTQKANNEYEKMYTSLAIKELQIKATVNDHYICVRMMKIQVMLTINASEAVEKLGPS